MNLVVILSMLVLAGAYHAANSMLRRQLPHYHAKVSVRVHWDHVFMWVLTIVSVIMYVGTRLYYLVSGKSATLSGGDVNIPFSWMTIVADGSLAVLGVYLHQNFWKQTVDFKPLTGPALQKLTKARSALLTCVLLNLTQNM